MKRKIGAILLAALLCCLWTASAFAATYGTVHGGWLRLRANPSYDATVIASYRNGTVVTVLSQENGWARVLTEDYRLGYMDARYLYIGDSPAPYYPVVTATPVPTATPVSRAWTEVNRTAYVTSANGRGVRLRSAPVVNSSNVLGLYPVGRTVTELRRSDDGWSYIRIDTKHGYMMTKFLVSSVVTATPTPFAPAVITPSPMYPGNYPFVTATPVTTATPTPAPASVEIQSVKLDPYSPTVGDTIKVIVTPSNAEYTAVWYNDQNTLLSTSKTYQVRESDVGHTINVRIMGVGASSGFVANAATAQVRAATPVETMVSTWVDP